MKTILTSLVLFFVCAISNAQITGDITVCAGYTYSYSANISGAATYNWSLPVSWYGLTGQGTSNINATCNVNDGWITVTGYAASGTVVGVETIQTQFGGGGASGWNVQPSSVSGCNGISFSLSVVPNGSGGGPGCPAGCGSGSFHPNIVYGIYDGVWPNGNYFGNADGFTTFILGGPGSPVGTVYIYLVDITNGVNPPQAIKIQGGCGGGVVNNTSNIAPLLPSLPVVTQTPMPACVGDTIQLFEISGLTNIGWGFTGGNDLNFISAQFSNPLIAVVSGNNPFTNVTGFDANGCMTYDPNIQVSISVCAAPNVQFSSSDTVFCDKQNINFNDLSSNGPTSWQWTFNGATPASSTIKNPQNIYYAANGSFDVTLIACNAAGCDTLTLSNFIVEYASPVASIYKSNDTLYASAAISYQWYETDSGLIAGATGLFFVPAQAGNYYCTIKDSVGCSGSSNTLAITTGIQNIIGNGQLAAVPNPSNGRFEISFNSISKITNLKCQIVNVLGEIVFANDTENVSGKFSLQVNLSLLPTGVYFLKATGDEKVFNQKIIIE